MYDQFTPIKKPFTGLMNFTPVTVGIAVVAACALLYCLWMSWSLNHPLIQRGPQVRRDDR